MSGNDRSRRAARSRPGSYPSSSRRPKQAPRPERRSASISPESTAIHLCPPSFVELSGDQEHVAVEALAELLVALHMSKATRSTLDTAIGHTGDNATGLASKSLDGEP
ncbi:MAG: hypothetical protein ACYCST_19285 [Acidimicrobiales bacterium]